MSETPVRIHDPKLRELLTALRKLGPQTAAIADQIAERFKFINRVLSNYDSRFEAQARAHIAAGRMEAASTTAWLLFDEDRQAELLGMITINSTQATQEARERVAHAIAMGRIVVGDE